MMGTSGISSFVNGGCYLSMRRIFYLFNFIIFSHLVAYAGASAFATQISEFSGETGGGDAYGTNGFGDANTLIEFSNGGINLDSAVSSKDDRLLFANRLLGQADHMGQRAMANNPVDSMHYAMGIEIDGKFIVDIDIDMMR